MDFVEEKVPEKKNSAPKYNMLLQHKICKAEIWKKITES